MDNYGGVNYPCLTITITESLIPTLVRGGGRTKWGQTPGDFILYICEAIRWNISFMSISGVQKVEVLLFFNICLMLFSNIWLPLTHRESSPISHSYPLSSKGSSLFSPVVCVFNLLIQVNLQKFTSIVSFFFHFRPPFPAWFRVKVISFLYTTHTHTQE